MVEKEDLLSVVTLGKRNKLESRYLCHVYLWLLIQALG